MQPICLCTKVITMCDATWSAILSPGFYCCVPPLNSLRATYIRVDPTWREYFIAVGLVKKSHAQFDTSCNEWMVDILSFFVGYHKHPSGGQY